MVSRKEEAFTHNVFEVGDQYSRPEIALLGGVEPLSSTREWGGIVEFENCVVLFSTLVKDDLPPEHAYADVFSATEFFWESQNQNTQTSPVILRIISLEAPILLFCRLTSKTKGKATLFTFVGNLTALDYDGERPVEFRFIVDQFLQDAPKNLLQLYDWRPDKKRTLKSVEAPDRKPRIGSGQGRQSDPKKKLAVEKRAMEVAADHYRKLGFSVTDTSANNPYDLECLQNNQKVRVEVKGLTGALGPVDVTSGEVRSARSEKVRTDLFIVHSMSLAEHGKSGYVGEGGETFIETGWSPPDERLEATRYRYTPLR